MASAARADALGRPHPLRLVSGGGESGREIHGSSRPPETFRGLRLVRTLAMVSIVGYHVTWEPLFGIPFGLTSLQIILCTLVCRSATRIPPSKDGVLRPFAAKRAHRLLVPWLLWSVLYAAFEASRALWTGAALGDVFHPWMWLSGTSFHLWFLPFGFAASLATLGGQRALMGLARPPSTWLLGLASAALVVAVDPLKGLLSPSMPLDLWLDGLPTLAYGLTLGRTLARPKGTARAAELLLVALTSLLPLLLAGPLLPHSGLFERYAMAVPVVCLGLLVDVPGERLLPRLAETNLGVYLVHMLAIRAVDHLPAVADAGGIPRILVVYLACLLAVKVLKRARVPYLL